MEQLGLERRGRRLAADPSWHAVSTSGRSAARKTSGISPIIWWFLAIPLALEAWWVFYPALESFYLSLTSWSGAGSPRYVGLRNYQLLLQDPIFWTALRNTGLWTLTFGGFSFVFGLLVARLLNRPRRGVTFFRIAFFLPMVLSLTVTGVFWQVIYQPGSPMYSLLALTGSARGAGSGILANPQLALWGVLVAALWREIGYIMVFYLAGFNGLDPALEEAAQVDGAGAWRRFWSIVMPQLREVHSIVFAILVIDSLRTFDIVWAMTQGGPFNSSQLLSTYMYQEAFTALKLGYSSAIAVIIFVLAIGFIITYLVRTYRTGVEDGARAH